MVLVFTKFHGVMDIPLRHRLTVFPCSAACGCSQKTGYYFAAPARCGSGAARRRRSRRRPILIDGRRRVSDVDGGRSLGGPGVGAAWRDRAEKCAMAIGRQLPPMPPANKREEL